MATEQASGSMGGCHMFNGDFDGGVNEAYLEGLLIFTYPGYCSSLYVSGLVES